jgi:YaiO family outer membrane protein
MRYIALSLLLLFSTPLSAKNLYQKAVSERNVGNLKGAEKYIDEYVNKYPNDLDGINMQALIKGSNKKNKEASEIISNALKKHPNNKELQINRVRLFIWGNDFKSAYDHIDELKLKYPNDKEVKSLNKMIENHEISREPVYKVSIEGGTSWFQDKRKKWYEESIEIKRQKPDNYALFRTTLKHRYGLDDTLFIIGAGKKIGSDSWLTFEGAVSPEANFVERYYIKLGGSTGLYELNQDKFFNSVTGILNTSYKSYKDDTLKSIEPGLRVYFYENKFWLTSTYIMSKAHSKSGKIDGRKFQLDWQVNNDLKLNIGGSYAPEVDNGILYNVKSRYVGALYNIEKGHLSNVSMTLNRETRASYKRYDFTLNLGFRF